MRRLKAKLGYFTRVARFVEMIFLLGVIQDEAAWDWPIFPQRLFTWRLQRRIIQRISLYFSSAFVCSRMSLDAVPKACFTSARTSFKESCEFLNLQHRSLVVYLPVSGDLG